ncbi:MAG: DUF4126 domain-containing protein [Thermodesulfobacteriota bacterium]
MDTLLAVFLGVGLSAACGFRIFFPLFIMSIASISGNLGLSQGFEWIATYPALITFGIATLFEILAYYIPWVDNLLDAIATPAAITAGVIVMAAAVGDMNPLLKWTLAVIVGGGIAGTLQGFTGLVRLASSATTGGLGNPVVSTMEAGGSFILSILAIFLPIVAFIAVLILMLFAIRKVYSRLFRKKQLTSG